MFKWLIGVVGGIALSSVVVLLVLFGLAISLFLLSGHKSDETPKYPYLDMVLYKTSSNNQSMSYPDQKLFVDCKQENKKCQQIVSKKTNCDRPENPQIMVVGYYKGYQRFQLSQSCPGYRDLESLFN